jgi:hypothetical protein
MQTSTEELQTARASHTLGASHMVQRGDQLI